MINLRTNVCKNYKIVIYLFQLCIVKCLPIFTDPVFFLTTLCLLETNLRNYDILHLPIGVGLLENSMR